MRILGISAFYHDSAAALVRDGVIVAAAQEERFSRKKHDAGFPKQAISYCFEAGGYRPADIDYVVFYEKPFLKFERLLETYVAFAPKGFNSFRKAMPLWLKEKLFQKKILCEAMETFDPDVTWQDRLLFSEHHLSHAASAFFPSPFREAAVLTMDGVGEWVTTSVALGNNNQLSMQKELHFPHSLGLLYSAFTYYCGFKVNSGEYKLMGLAPYGEPKFTSLILDNLIDLKPDGSFRINQKYFDYCTGLTMTNKKFEALLGQPVRQPEQELTQFHMDIAASIQDVTETVVLRLCKGIVRDTGAKNLCLAGGVALNCVANGRIQREGLFENLDQPAAGDAGGALGAALAAYHLFLDKPRSYEHQRDAMKGAYLGPSFAQVEIEERLTKADARFKVMSQSEMLAATANALSEGKAIGWVQGPMEFGPRALGGRSILGDPRSKTMQKMLNLKIKYRESFRPFAPSVLHEDVDKWFDFKDDSPYMLLVAGVREDQRLAMTDKERALFGIDKLNVPRSTLPAVTHVDYSARLQTVYEDTSPVYYALLAEFKKITGCGVLINTSFNVRGEPIVCTPEDAFRCFMGTELDILVVGNCVLDKTLQNPALCSKYAQHLEQD